MRSVTIKLKYSYWGLMKGIYRISVGGKFYIGSAKNAHARCAAHHASINRALREYPMRCPGALQHYHWCPYIFENAGIELLPMVLIQRCISDSQLYFAEQYYLNEYVGHPDCLNVAPSVRRPDCFRGMDDNLWDVEVGKGWTLTYFNPNDKENTSLNGFLPLRSDGKISKKEQKRLSTLCLRDTPPISG